MAGMSGFIHLCDLERREKLPYKAPLSEQALFDNCYKRIYDFYITKSFAADTQQKIELSAYGWEGNSKEKGLKTLESLLAENAGIDKFCLIRSTTIKDTLTAMAFSGEYICADHPRAVMMQDYAVKVSENEEFSFESNKESRINCIFRHMRNAIAHGGTYFFDNGMMLLEDIKSANKVTAEVLIPQQSLIDWIDIVDRNHVLEEQERH